MDKRTSRRKLKQTFSPDQTRKTLFKTKKLRHSREKKTLATFKTGGRNFKACLSFGWESSCPNILKLIKQNRRTKKLQKHAGSSLEAKIDTVLNVPGRVQPQIDSLT